MGLTRRQRAVGRCPKCKRHPTWFNDIPLTAFCWGPNGKPHDEMVCVVPGDAQPYAKMVRTPKKAKWKRGKLKVKDFV